MSSDSSTTVRLPIRKPLMNLYTVSPMTPVGNECDDELLQHVQVQKRLQ